MEPDKPSTPYGRSCQVFIPCARSFHIVVDEQLARLPNQETLPLLANQKA